MEPSSSPTTTPSPNTRHQDISGRIFAMIWNYLEMNPIGRIFHAPWDVVFSDVDVVEPDIVYVSNERGNVITPAHARGAPDLVIEIGSPGTRRRDETLKRRLYERDDVTEYWIVDPEHDRVRIFRREQSVFAEPLVVTRHAQDVLTTPLLPGLELLPARVFRD